MKRGEFYLISVAKGIIEIKIPDYYITANMEISSKDNISVKKKDGFYCLKRKFAIPIVDHLHSDKENGQNEAHYHIDDRFILKGINIPKELIRIYPDQIQDFSIEYEERKCIYEEMRYITDPSSIKNSKFNRNCMKNNKCVHTGYDLSNEKSIDGIITCPLHGLKYNSLTKTLIQNEI